MGEPLTKKKQIEQYFLKRGYSDQVQQSAELKFCTSSGNIGNIHVPKLEQTIRHYHNILQVSDWLGQAYPSLPIIAFRPLRNLHHIYWYGPILIPKEVCKASNTRTTDNDAVFSPIYVELDGI